MSQSTVSSLLESPTFSSTPFSTDLEDASPFGLQGLTRQTLRVLKPDCVVKLAITLALRLTRQQIRDIHMVQRELSYHPDWADEYQVVHLIEKSLWIQGHSELVMTMTRNPSHIPDNPPAKIMQALARAYTLHPEATIWYGVPLFGDDVNAEGLPIPVTAAQVRAEALRRIDAAQQHALMWGWLYRAALGLTRVPARTWQFTKRVAGFGPYAVGCVSRYWKRARADLRRRGRAAIKARLEQYRQGYSTTIVPEHQTWLGRGFDAAGLALELLAYQAAFVAQVAPFVAGASMPLAIAKFAPLLFIPVTVVSCDPFLFVELPEELGKLRHLGHWYWQTTGGRKKLHLHT